MLKMNLQYFAEEEQIEQQETQEEVEFEIETDEVDNNENEKSEDEQDAGEKDETEVETEVEPSKENEVLEEKQVPLKALQAERQKWKDRVKQMESKASIADKLAKMSGVDVDALQTQIDQFEQQNYIKQGVDPQMAQALVQQQKQMAEFQQSLNKQKMDMEFNSIKSEPYYADAENYREELEELAGRTGLTVKQAYDVLRGDERRKEYEREMEQRILNNLQKKQKTKIDTSASGNQQPKPKVNLTAEQLEFAKFAGMTPQEYFNMLNTKNLDQYQKRKKG